MTVRQLLDITGRTALVTGGSRGLGLQMAEALGEMGARVALVARKRDELEAAAAHLRLQGIEALPLACDMSNSTGISQKITVKLGATDGTWTEVTDNNLKPDDTLLISRKGK